MSSGNILFEQTYKGDVWRLEISTYQGRQRGNWRKWYRAEDGWRPSREGCTIPLERLPDLACDLTAFVATIAPSGPEIGSQGNLRGASAGPVGAPCIPANLKLYRDGRKVTPAPRRCR